MTEPHDPRDDAGDAAPHDVHDALAAFSLDALDADERAAVEDALSDSPDLRAKADAYSESAAQLADLVVPVTPPPALKDRLMARLDAAPQLDADGGSDADADGGSRPRQAAAPQSRAAEPEAAVPSPTADRPPGPAEITARRRWFQRPGAIIAAAAASVVLIVGVIVGIGWSGPNGWGAQREMDAIAEAADVQSATHEIEGGGAVTLYWSAEQGRSGVVVEGLPELGADETYELWYIDDDGPQSAGTFDMRGDETWRVLDGPFAPGVAVGVTVEPAGGSPQPTTDPIVVIET